MKKITNLFRITEQGHKQSEIAFYQIDDRNFVVMENSKIIMKMVKRYKSIYALREDGTVDMRSKTKIRKSLGMALQDCYIF